MRIAVLGTGVVGRTLAARLDGLGHDVVIGTWARSGTPTSPSTSRTPDMSRAGSREPKGA